MMKSKTDFIRFTAQIKKVTSKIDVAGDKIADMNLGFYATNKNLADINALQQPDMEVEIMMRPDPEWVKRQEK